MEPLRYLYYPYINFRNESWLKNMALFSDSVLRIVPMNYPTRKTETVVALEQEGFVENVWPGEAGPEPAQLFGQFLIDYAEVLKPGYRVDGTQPWRSDLEDKHLEEEEETERAYVEASKLDGADIDEMEATELVLRGREGDVNWIGMHPKLANIYMTLLANRIAENRQAVKLSADYASHHVNVHASCADDIGRALLPEVFARVEAPPAAPELRRSLVTFVFEQLIPRELDDVPIEKILKLRNEHYEDFVRYQEVIDKFVKEGAHLAEIGDADDLQKHIHKEFKGKIAPSLKRLKRALYLAKVKYWGSVLAVSFTPPALAAMAGVAAPLLVTGALGGACGLMTLTARTQGELDRALERNSYSWLYRLERDLKPDSVVKEVVDRARAFVYPH